MNNLNNRVVVTGLGMLTPLGLNLSATWEGLIAGKSGIDYITLFDAEPFATKFAGEVKDLSLLIILAVRMPTAWTALLNWQ